jgi:endoglucanase
MVKSVTKEGFVRFLPLGGWWGHVVLAQRLVIKTRRGDVVGVVGSKPPHELREEDRKRVLEIKDLYIDVGATSDWDVRRKLDIRPGDPIVPTALHGDGEPDPLLAKAWDNRTAARSRPSRPGSDVRTHALVVATAKRRWTRAARRPRPSRPA